MTVRAWSPIATICNEVTNAAGGQSNGAWYVAFDLAMPDEEEPEPLTVQRGYTACGVTEDYPVGFQHFTFQKRLMERHVTMEF